MEVFLAINRWLLREGAETLLSVIILVISVAVIGIVLFGLWTYAPWFLYLSGGSALALYLIIRLDKRK